MPRTEESALVKLAKQGNQDAFEALMTSYQKPIYNLCFRMCRNTEDAEELTQTSFLKAWSSLPRFQEDSTFFTWLYRLATNTCIDFLRQERRRNTILQSVSLEHDDQFTAQIPDVRYLPEEEALKSDLRQSLLRAMDELSEEHRSILLQRELDGLSYQEIADLLGLELGTVKSRIARARLALRQILLRDGNFFEGTASKESRAHKGGDA